MDIIQLVNRYQRYESALREIANVLHGGDPDAAQTARETLDVIEKIVNSAYPIARTVGSYAPPDRLIWSFYQRI